MTRRLILPCVIVCLFGIALALLGQSARLLQQVEAQGLKVQYSSGSPLAGKAFVALEQQWQPMWLAVSWRWCPRLNIARWCVSANGDTVQADGALSLGFNTLTLTNTQISANDIQLTAAGFVEIFTSIEGNIKQLRLQNAATLEAIDSIDATVILSDIYALDFGFAPHRIQATGSAEEGFLLTIDGAEANGNIKLKTSGDYHANIALTPSEDIAALLKNQLPEAQQGVFTFEYSGVLAALQ